MVCINMICPGKAYSVGIKSVNHRYNDVTIKLPRVLNSLEDNIRKQMLKSISRGKIDVYVSYLNYGDVTKEIRINKGIAKVYIQELRELAKETEIDNKIDIIEVVKLPDVLTIENTGNEEEFWDSLLIALTGAIEQFDDMRKAEGNRIQADLEKRLQLLPAKIEQITNLSTDMIKEYSSRLEERIKELLKTDVIDQTRLSQEVIIFADKCSTQEEVTRFKSHIEQFLNTIKKSGPIGKNMDFIIQEMNREINTIGSKANNLEITKIVVEVKTILEDIREQVQNIE